MGCCGKMLGAHIGRPSGGTIRATLTLYGEALHSGVWQGRNSVESGFRVSGLGFRV